MTKEKLIDILLIIFGLLLALALIGYFSKTKSTGTSGTSQNQNSNSQISNHESSGVNIITP